MAGREGRPTIYDVARLARVSIATVSHVLNRPERVGAATRERVLAVIDDLQFVPKEVAVSRARRGTGRIGVLAPFTSYPSYLQRLAGILENRSGRTEVVVFDHDSVAADPHPLLASLPVSGRLDGLIIMGVPLDRELAERQAKHGLPTVLVDSEYEGFSSVSVSDDHGGLVVGRHLAELGHRHIAFLAEDQASNDYLSPGQRRWRAVERAFGEAGVPESAIRRVVCGPDFAGAREALHEILALDPRPTAVFAHHDELAAGVVTAARQLGLRVPEDLAVIGYDGGVLADALQLTTVVQPLRESGVVGRRLLMARLDGDTTTQQIMLEPRLSRGVTT
ncbi:LacI family DNA-binding transcriptional regulator [Aeromicrobium duanguangcaii]|uniref:LacI family transcriptional regulator n=1 Tax=Aeromicrobium duanguangcaii TaxID=2968086 RepID=A0ABY5KK39_9ACTN|nr:LacI family DNA-binding transcriptional regulator [Aeromicrobium duanguangcaii]MCD9153391.1 LacI family transcriptional regulator [Aeromicrobium duanguangcaii]UUI69517.1 LacI family transcriptional regulator [Aeromicrobium duanguangcaii]